MDERLIRVESHEGIATITLARPEKRNALTYELLEEMEHALRRMNDAEDEHRLLVLTAEGTVFCAGMDLGQMLDRADQPDAQEQWQRDTEVYRDVVWSLFNLNIPTLAVLPGPALAGGLGLVLACDLVLSSDTAWFALPEPQRGITAAVVAPLLLHRVGSRWAEFLLISGQSVSATEGEEIGLCHRVVPESELETRAAEWKTSILQGGPLALRQTKTLLREFTHDNIWNQLKLGMQISAEARENDEAREGLSAFREKRKPNWFK
ncbi:MAG: enoyl-CoA hydratase/isomerase family protein [Planctomycetota bacterium]|nr:enoyl-CoA hydratase/isomerase family protein [Planctomycetota bacterium]MDA1211453.1 enoyl-CoA hydratase/isomerase family protein [Planctomycetota bacterium]